MKKLSAFIAVMALMMSVAVAQSATVANGAAEVVQPKQVSTTTPGSKAKKACCASKATAEAKSCHDGAKAATAEVKAGCADKAMTSAGKSCCASKGMRASATKEEGNE